MSIVETVKGGNDPVLYNLIRIILFYEFLGKEYLRFNYRIFSISEQNWS